MTSRRRTVLRIAPHAAAVLLVTASAGCSRPAIDPLAPPEPPVLWPKPPDDPRVRFLGKLTGSQEVTARRSSSPWWEELLYGPTPPAVFVSPYAVAVNADGNRVAVADTDGGCVHVFDLAKHTYQRHEVFGTPPRRLECPIAVAWAADTLWIADAKLHAVAKLDPSGQASWIGGEVLSRPAGLAYCAANDLCYVSDAAAHAVLAFDREGALVFQFGSHGAEVGQFNHPSHLACGAKGTLFVADSLNSRVQRFGLDGAPLGTFGRKGDAAGDLSLPKGVAVDPGGNVWVVDAHFENVQAFTPEGQLLLAIGGEGDKPGEFWLPAGICIDARRRMWIADTGNHRVQVFELLGL